MTAGHDESFSARLTDQKDAGGGLVWVRLLPAPKAAATYRVPGQYVMVRIDDASGYFALAGDEGAGTWQLLLRPNAGAADALLSAPIGAHVHVSAARGEGFPFDSARDAPLAIAVTAGALGPALPAAFRRVREGLAAQTTLLVGTHSPAGVPAGDVLDELRRRGVDVRTVFSDHAGAEHRGFVQDHLDAVGAKAVWVAGVPAMVDAVRAWGHGRRIPVHTNH